MIGVTVDFWIRLLFGHLVGDYIFQSESMALKKSGSYRVCALHCAIYTASVAAWLVPEMIGSALATAAFIAIVFCSHFAIDKSPLVQKLLGKIGARTFERAAKVVPSKEISEVSKQFYVAFTAIVHAVADNTLHFIVMYVGLAIINAVPW